MHLKWLVLLTTVQTACKKIIFLVANMKNRVGSQSDGFVETTGTLDSEMGICATHCGPVAQLAAYK